MCKDNIFLSKKYIKYPVVINLIQTEKISIFAMFFLFWNKCIINKISYEN